MTSPAPPAAPGAAPKRDGFKSRKVFILAAIGSAVGLGNIWRFPYTAYEGGGGAFLVPYLIALLTAGLPFLMLDYAVGHRYRGSAPLSFRRISRHAEWLGWWQAGICAVIAVYYAVILAWAARYVGFSINLDWHADPKAFFADFLQVADTPGVSTEFVPAVLWPLVGIWLVVILIMALGVDKGIGFVSVVFIPMLVVVFLFLVVQALFLPGASVGLEAFFTPDWSALTKSEVWIAAYGQIFFSLSIGFGIMITYASYVDKDEDMTGSGLVVGFANSSFELLAGIGVFAALGFMAVNTGLPVDKVAGGGIGLAFFAFPTIISQAPGGTLLGVLFFLSLLIAGITSLVSVLEVGISALREKLGLERVPATLLMCLPVAAVSIFFFASTTGLYVLDTVDAFINSFGILAVALVSMVMLAYVFRELPVLARHLNRRGSLQLRRVWFVLVGGVAPVALLIMLIDVARERLETPYEGYPESFIAIFGWGVAGGVLLLSFVVAALPWSRSPHITHKHEFDPHVDDPEPGDVIIRREQS